ncbi:cysteine desulfurase family protein [Hyphomicrobium sp. CS1BSMeth3]|uniref:cysteine desulfurase family protein n=1 Tax=Hyphomicrobium sp. CS1BSMeth3 TaxID=1892844 RepID=UPI0009300202|nr:cysteine desulfurase family protein [Hyphomicrobium sp. CS1BSMeth3]
MTAERTYLDWNATAPLLPEARAAIERALDVHGNPSSVHAEGRRARAVVETAREQVAALIGARPSEIVFTSGATEACATVLAAPWSAILVAGIEHDAVLRPAEATTGQHIALAVDADGRVDLAEVGDKARSAVTEYGAGNILAALQIANNETGVLQPLPEVAAIAREAGALVFTDAAQAAGRIPIDFAAIGADFMALSAHKLGGPKGIGALVVRDGRELPPLIRGGGQERRRRGGTENIPGIAGFGAAADVARKTVAEHARIAALRDRLEANLLDTTPEARIVGAGTERLPNTTCIALPGHAAETLVIRFDLAGIAVSAGAACSAGKIGASHVLMAMGLDETTARSAIRISIGPTTTNHDIDRCVAAWREIAAHPRARTAA